MSWYEYNEEQYIKNEREIAFQEGEEQGKIESAKRMLEDGNLPVEKIAYFLGFSLEQILEFQREMQ